MKIDRLGKGVSRTGLIVLAGLVGLSIGWQILSVFMMYDDEGYVLHSLNEFSRHGSLYDTVYSQYGPLYYLVTGGAARIFGFEWGHDLSRIATGLAWLATALAGGMITFRLSGSRLAGAIGMAATSAHLGQMAYEPMHPGNFLAPLIAIGAATSLFLWERGRHYGFMVCVAALSAACIMIKINVGVFVALAGGLWWWFHSDALKLSRPIVNMIGIGVGIAVPVLLILRHIPTLWGTTFVAMVSITIGTAGWLLIRRPNRNLSASHLYAAVMAGCTTLAGIIVATIATGSSWTGLWQGVVAGPLQHADVYHFPPNWRTGTLTLTLLSFIGFYQVERRRKSDGQFSSTSKTIILVIRLLLMAAFLASTFAMPSRSVSVVMTVLAGSMGWLLTPLNAANSNPVHQARIWIGLILGWQFLHAYPVAGTQLTWGTFLWLPLLITAVDESLRELWKTAAHSPLVRFSITGVVIAGLAIAVLNPLRVGYFYFSHASPLNLPGANLLRVPPNIGSGLRIISANAALHGRLLYSLPGSFSYNLWTGLPTPTSQNVTHWFTLLEADRQSTIVDRMRESDRAGWVVYPDLIETTAAADPDFKSPLLTYWRDNFRPFLRIDGIELHLPDHYPGVMINTANYYLPSESSSLGLDEQMIQVAVALSPGDSIDRIEVHVLRSDQVSHDPAHDWHADNTTVSRHFVYPQGAPVEGSAFTRASWPLRGQGITQFRFILSGPVPNSPFAYWWLKFRDPAGNLLAEARFDSLPPARE